jgi:AraC family transcriptional regulator of adaptative response/methylated-DNA-[protein]-cysteine methyltransferase
MPADKATLRRQESRASMDPRWAAVVARDHQADGAFFYSVETTGVYCRPSCGSRLANPKNVRFHRTAADAARAGFRPCRRCRPDQPALEQLHAARVADACRVIETAEEMPTLAVLANGAGLSPYHFHRCSRRQRSDAKGLCVSTSGETRPRPACGATQTVTEATTMRGSIPRAAS